MDKILHADHAILAELFFDKDVVGEGDTLLLYFAVAALVDEFADGLEVGIAVSDERLDNLQHFVGCLCEADEYAVVDLKETEELEGFALLGVDLVDTGLG